jgi:hypothetical protein
MRLGFDAAMNAAAVAEAGVDAAKSLGTAIGSANELGIAERIQLDLIRRDEDIAVIVRTKALRDKQRIIALPVRPVRRGEGGRKLVLVRLEIVSVGQRPIGRPAELDHGVAHHGLEGQHIAAVPGQEVPTAVLALLGI